MHSSNRLIKIYLNRSRWFGQPLSILGNDIDALVDMTIVYPDGAPGYSEFWLGEVPRIAG